MSAFILRRIRQNILINRLIRNFIRSFINLFSWLSFRWRVSGTIKTKFNNIPFYFYGEADDGILDSMYYKGNYKENKELLIFSEIVKASKLVMDVGANSGIYTVIGGVINKEAAIYSFEPHPHNLNRLKKNVAINNLSGQVTIVEKAVGDSVKIVDFNIPVKKGISDTSSVISEFSKSSYQGQLSWQNILVEQVTLDRIVEDYNLQGVDLIKIDVEGYELSVFNGIHQVVHGSSPIIICEIFINNEKIEFFESFAKRNGYYIYLILEEGLLRLDDGIKISANNSNYLFARGRTEFNFTNYSSLNKIISELQGGHITHR